MQTQNGFQTLPAPVGYKIGSFRLNEQSLTHLRAAMGIARKMRKDNDGEVEDAARAIVMLFGSCIFDDDWFDVEVTDETDLDRQTIAYMDGVAELKEIFPMSDRGAMLCRHRYVS